MNNSTTTPSPSPGPPSPKPKRSSTAGVKRKATMPPKYYAVRQGFKPGVYYNWPECFKQITKFKGALYKTFETKADAELYVNGGTPAVALRSKKEPTRFYAIQRGHTPGVYTEWDEAQKQIKGFQNRPLFKKFNTRKEAEEFVQRGLPKNNPTRPVPGTMATNPSDVNGEEVPAGIAPLPPNAEDGFDPNILLDPATGKVVYKTPGQKLATKAQPTAPPGMLRIYTDGSSLNNGFDGARAGVGVYFGPGDNRNVSEPLKGERQTNQRAELTAILRGLEIAPRHRPVTIVTDSRYAIDCVTTWFPKWVRNNWQTASNKPVENKDLIQSVLVKINERESLQVETNFEWVKGHGSDPGNVEADRLAVDGARKSADSASIADNLPDELADDLND